MRLARYVSVVAAILLVGKVCGEEAVALTPWWRPTDFDGVATVEQRLLDLTNAARRERRLPPLAVDPALTTAARQHSAEMLAERYFSHTSPHRLWARPADRAYRSGYWEAYVAENIVMLETSEGRIPDDQLADQLMFGDDGWMNSPGHRANILSEDYTRIGIGVAIRGGRHYATQLFGRHYYEFSELALRVAGNQLELAGRARLVGDTRRVHLALDKTLLEAIDVERGKAFRFKVLVPRDGRHRVGLHPMRDARSYWVKYCFYLDAREPPERALIMPFEDE